MMKTKVNVDIGKVGANLGRGHFNFHVESQRWRFKVFLAVDVFPVLKGHAHAGTRPEDEL